MNRHSQPIYTCGLRFECTRCGRCCSGFPGFVYLSEPDIKRISSFLSSKKYTHTHRSLDPGLFLERYTIVVSVCGEKRISLIEKRTYDCIFWDKTCTIYPARPYQCRAFPFWENNLISQREWDTVKQRCPGIGKGKLYTRNEIEQIAGSIPQYSIDTFSNDFLENVSQGRKQT